MCTQPLKPLTCYIHNMLSEDLSLYPTAFGGRLGLAVHQTPKMLPATLHFSFETQSLCYKLQVLWHPVTLALGQPVGFPKAPIFSVLLRQTNQHLSHWAVVFSVLLVAARLGLEHFLLEEKNGTNIMHKVSSKADQIQGTIKKKGTRQEKHHPCSPWYLPLSFGQNSEEWREGADWLISKYIMQIPISTILHLPKSIYLLCYFISPHTYLLIALNF